MAEKPKEKMIVPESMLTAMEEMERFNGTTKEKIVENWYELKRRIVSEIVEKKDEGEDTKD